MSGVPVGTINKILNGETKSPRYDTLNALESVLFPTETYPNMFCDSASPMFSKRPGQYTIEGKRTKQGIFGAPDMCIEVISPSTRKRDYGIKVTKYNVSFHANISSQNYIIVFSIQTEDLDSHINLEQEINGLKADFINRLDKTSIQF